MANSGWCRIDCRAISPKTAMSSVRQASKRRPFAPNTMATMMSSASGMLRSSWKFGDCHSSTVTMLELLPPR